MKKLYLSALILFVFVSILTQNRVACAQGNGSQFFESGLSKAGRLYIPGEFIVKFKPNTSPTAIYTLNSTHDVSIIYTPRQTTSLML